MRRIIPLALLSLVWCLFAGSPAEAGPFTEVFFSITHDIPGFQTNPGTMSYAGGTAPLVGNNIAVSSIVRSLAAPVEIPSRDLLCVNCTLSFSTGPFAGTIPAQEPGGLANYLFSGGGSLEIIGGATELMGGTIAFSLPEGTTLLTGVPTDAFTFQSPGFNLDQDQLVPLNHLLLSFEGALHPDLASHFGFPAGASLDGDSRIATAETGNAPNPFVLSTFTNTDNFEPSFVRVTLVPLPDSFWPFAIGFVALAVWRACRQAVSFHG